MYQVYDYWLVMGWDQKKKTWLGWALLGKAKLSWVFLTSLYFLLHDCSNFLGSSLKVEPGLSKKAQFTIYLWLIVDVSNSNALKWGMNTRVWHMSLTCRSFFSLWHLTLTQDDTWDFPLFVIDGKKTSNVCSALSSN